LVEDSGRGYFILSLRKTLSPVTIDPMSLIKDIGDQLYTTGNSLRGISLPNENRSPQGTDCTAIPGNFAGVAPTFICGNSKPSAIVIEDRNSLVAIRTGDGKYETVKDILETSQYLNRLDKHKARLTIIDEPSDQVSGKKGVEADKVSSPDASVDNDDSNFVSDDDVSKLYSESKALIIAANTYQNGAVCYTN
jgi:hypothetical protein